MTGRGEGEATSRLTSLSARWAIAVAAAWVIAAVLLAVFAPSLTKVGVQDETAFLPAASPSLKAQQELARLFPGDPSLDSAVVVLSRPGGLTAADRAYLGRLDAFLSSPDMRPAVSQVESPATDSGLATVLSSPDRAADLVVVGLRAAPFTPQATTAVNRIRAWLNRSAPAGLAHPVTGEAALGADEESGITSSFTRTAVISILLVLVILLLVYRSVLAALVPLATIGVAFLVAQGAIALLAAHGLKVASLAATFMVVMVFGAGTDYCLFLVSRYRQELPAGPQRRAALGRARAAVAPVLVASGATVILGFLSQLTARFGMYRTMGPALGIAIAVTVAAGLTLTPALLALLGRAAFWPTRLEQVKARPPGLQRWQRLANLVGAHPRRISLAVLVALAAPACGTLWLHQSFDLISEVPSSSGAAQGAALLARHLPAGDVAPIEILIQAPRPIRTADGLAAIDRLTENLKELPGIAQVRSATQPGGAPITARAPTGQLGGLDALKALGLDPDRVDVTPLYTAMASPQGLRLTEPVLARYPQLGRRLSYFYGTGGDSTRLLVAANGDPYSPAALQLVPQLKQATAASLAGGPLAADSIQVGGPPASIYDISHISSSDFHRIVLVVLAVTLIVLILLLRAVVAPLYLLGTVVLSYLAALGLTVTVFSGIAGRGSLPFWLPPLLFVILVALGADYNIFLTGRMREALDSGARPADAALSALVQTGPVISSAGLILAGTFFALMLAPLTPLAEAGFAVTAGVLIDTFIVRSLLVPALTVWIGDVAFWSPTWADLPARTRQALGDGGALTLLGAIAVLFAGVIGVAIHSPKPAATATPPSRPAHTAAAKRTPTAGRPDTPAPVTSPATSQAATTPQPDPTTAVSPTARPATTLPVATTSPPSSTTSSSPSQATRIAIPAVGSWTYHLSGTRRIGAAGSNQPFSQDVATQVSQVGGNSQTAVMRLYTSSNAGTQDDQRRYSPSEVDWTSTQVSSAALSYGGNFSPPVPLIYWPPRIGASWTTNWTTGSTNGHTTTTLTGTRQANIAGHTYTCYTTKTNSNFTGSVQGNQQTISCWIPQLGMSAEDQTTEQGTYNGVSFYANTDAVLQAVP